MATTGRGTDFWILQLTGWLLVLYLVIAQAIPAFSYELGVRMGTQESAAQISEVGVAFWYGFAFGDLVIYIPLLSIGLVGVWRRVVWGRVTLSAALGISAYWPIVSLAAVVDARGAPGWNLSDETAFWIVLPPITLWSIWGLVWLIRDSQQKP